MRKSQIKLFSEYFKTSKLKKEVPSPKEERRSGGKAIAQKQSHMICCLFVFCRFVFIFFFFLFVTFYSVPRM